MVRPDRDLPRDVTQKRGLRSQSEEKLESFEGEGEQKAREADAGEASIEVIRGSCGKPEIRMIMRVLGDLGRSGTD